MKRGRPARGTTQVTLWLDAAILERSTEIATLLGATVHRNDVIRMAIVRGLLAVERLTGECVKVISSSRRPSASAPERAPERITKK